MRLDKFLCEMNIGSRSQVKVFIRQGTVTVNDTPTTNPDQQIDEFSDRVAFRGKALQYRRFVYYMMNKPEGVVSASRDNTARTVVSLLGKDAREDIFPVGRLDKDVTGLLLLTNDGDLAHRLLSPKKHVDKTYRAVLEHVLLPEDIRRLENGLDIGEENLTLPARVTVLEERIILLTLHEGKFHQVKRMLQAVDNQVLQLRRTAFGGLTLDPNLAPGEYRELSGEELETLRKSGGRKQKAQEETENET
ncbi:pseudouridine synthase [Acetatifactor aquisgranensis]|uniref:pseudouridine synthase n=1 Tax=Acetatifactor aquisgranensis TaxID=2941233 RepID=UPI00203F47CE|nr:pseudouridine synthase [Acetatifactor aquisgranensis]